MPAYKIKPSGQVLTFNPLKNIFYRLDPESLKIFQHKVSYQNGKIQFDNTHPPLVAQRSLSHTMLQHKLQYVFTPDGMLYYFTKPINKEIVNLIQYIFSYTDLVPKEKCISFINALNKLSGDENVIQYLQELLDNEPIICFEDPKNKIVYRLSNKQAHRSEWAGPTLTTNDGRTEYLHRGQLHRFDGPAYEDLQTTIWLHKGLRHRNNGPAFKTPNEAFYYQFGLIHRMDGPAVIRANEEKYFIAGHRLSKEQFQRFKNEGRTCEIKHDWKTGNRTVLLKNSKGELDSFLTIPSETEVKQGKIFYRWHSNGKKHRLDGPACRTVSTLTHREIDKEYWINGLVYNQEYFNREAKNVMEKERLEEKAVEPRPSEKVIIAAKNGDPNLVCYSTSTESVRWELKSSGKLHYVDGPAVVKKDGTREFWHEGKLHCRSGPAVIRPDGQEEYYINGVKLDKLTFQEAITYSLSPMKFKSLDKTVWHHYNTGRIHRVRGPAEIGPEKNVYWLNNVRLSAEQHRQAVDQDLDVELLSGAYTHVFRDKITGLAHNALGPAVFGKHKADDTYYIHGVRFSEAAFSKIKENSKRRGTLTCYYDLKDGLVFKDEKGLLHREEGPAVYRPDGSIGYYFHGQLLTEQDWRQKVQELKSESRQKTPKVKSDFPTQEISKRITGLNYYLRMFDGDSLDKCRWDLCLKDGTLLDTFYAKDTYVDILEKTINGKQTWFDFFKSDEWAKRVLVIADRKGVDALIKALRPAMEVLPAKEAQEDIGIAGSVGMMMAGTFFAGLLAKSRAKNVKKNQVKKNKEVVAQVEQAQAEVQAG